MILTGDEILKRYKKGDISITPFSQARLNPNSYDLSLDNTLLYYENSYLDIKKKSTAKKVIIPKTGLLLHPGTLYLGNTVEYTKTFNLVPMIEGRSSLGRLGISIHATAGFGDVGFCGRWTLEISVIHPIKIYPYIQCCQIYYHTLKGKIKNYEGKYQDAIGVMSSKMNLEF